MVTNYQRGRSAEYKAVKELQAAGYIVTRSAGSHGLWDIMAVNKNGVRLIQIKSDADENDVRYDCNVAKEKMATLPRPLNVTCEVWGRMHGKTGWLIQEVL